jgi:hypothetical protein
MIKQQLGDRLDGWIHTAFPFLFVRPLNPDLLTVIGAIGSIAAAAAFAEGWLVCGGILMLASGFFDLVDGVVARHQGISAPSSTRRSTGSPMWRFSWVCRSTSRESVSRAACCSPGQR